jgi:hypothetical protein
MARILMLGFPDPDHLKTGIMAAGQLVPDHELEKQSLAYAEGLFRLTDMLRSTLANQPDLDTKKKEISAFLPKDLIQDGLGEELIVEVKFFSNKGDRSGANLNKAAGAVWEVLRSFAEEHLTECTWIEVSIEVLGSDHFGHCGGPV